MWQMINHEASHDLGFGSLNKVLLWSKPSVESIRSHAQAVSNWQGRIDSSQLYLFTWLSQT